MSYVDGWDLVKEGLEEIKDDLFYYKPRRFWENILIKLKLKAPPKLHPYNSVVAEKLMDDFYEQIYTLSQKKMEKLRPYITVKNLEGE